MITQEKLKKHLDYDPNTGIFVWLVPTSTRVSAGDEAGNLGDNGYISIGFSGRLHRAHRLAWLYMTGELPEFPRFQIDHIDGNRSNNKWENLRGVDCAENRKNLAIRSDNTSGYVGVHWASVNNGWMATICLDSRKRYLGCFKDKEDAIRARKKAEVEFGFHENHGRSK